MGNKSSTPEEASDYADKHVLPNLIISPGANVEQGLMWTFWTGRVIKYQQQEFKLNYSITLKDGKFQVEVPWPESYPQTRLRTAFVENAEMENKELAVLIMQITPEMLELLLFINKPQQFVASGEWNERADLIDNFENEKNASKGLMQEALCISLLFLKKSGYVTGFTRVRLEANGMVATVPADRNKFPILNNLLPIDYDELRDPTVKIEQKKKNIRKILKFLRDNGYYRTINFIDNANLDYVSYIVIFGTFMRVLRTIPLVEYYERLGFSKMENQRQNLSDYKVDMSAPVDVLLSECSERNNYSFI
jgi:hypothetical protein